MFLCGGRVLKVRSLCMIKCTLAQGRCHEQQSNAMASVSVSHPLTRKVRERKKEGGIEGVHREEWNHWNSKFQQRPDGKTIYIHTCMQHIWLITIQFQASSQCLGACSQRIVKGDCYTYWHMQQYNWNSKAPLSQPCKYLLQDSIYVEILESV